MSDFLPDGVAMALGLSSAAIPSPAPQGMTSEVTFVDDQERRTTLKRCRNPVYIHWLRREQRVLEELSRSSLHIPRVLGYHEIYRNGEVVDAWLLTTRVPGRSLWDALRRTRPVDRSKYFAALGNLLREVHSTRPPESFKSSRPWIDRRLEQAHKNLHWCDGSAELLARIEAARPAAEPATLIHGDLALDNVLVADDGTMSLIDWSDGDLGDPRYDLALALATEPELPLRDDDVNAFYNSYGAAPLDPAVAGWFVNLSEFF